MLVAIFELRAACRACVATAQWGYHVGFVITWSVSVFTQTILHMGDKPKVVRMVCATSSRSCHSGSIFTEWSIEHVDL